MFRPGHYGAALLVYAPVGFVAMLLDGFQAGLLGGVVAVALAMVPDWDIHLPGLTHRGITHTVYFAVAVGVLLALLAGYGASSRGPTSAAAFAAFGFLVGTGTLCSHIAADALTPAGVDPFGREDPISFGVAKSGSLLANYALLGVGLLAVAAAVGAANALGAV